MNKMLTTAVVFGAGMAAYNLVQRNNMMSARQMKKLQRKITRLL